MDYKKVEQAIKDFTSKVLAMENIYEKLDEVLNISPESEYFMGVYGLIGGYVKALDAAYFIGGWLEWWMYECGLGKNEMEAGLPNEKMRKIKNIDDFVKIVIDDLKSTEKNNVNTSS